MFKLFQKSTSSRSLPLRRQMTNTRITQTPIDATKAFDIEQDFGKYCFNDNQMKNRVTPDIYKRYKASLKNKTPLDADVADSIAHAMKEWALSHGATHYAHW